MTGEAAAQLNEVLMAVRQREAVVEAGFANKIADGTGVSALFYGNSGTGKSMAAEANATELGVDLIRIDLANVLSKYVGETGKGLSTIFDMGCRDAGVLFFDEAGCGFCQS